MGAWDVMFTVPRVPKPPTSINRPTVVSLIGVVGCGSSYNMAYRTTNRASPVTATLLYWFVDRMARKSGSPCSADTGVTSNNGNAKIRNRSLPKPLPSACLRCV